MLTVAVRNISILENSSFVYFYCELYVDYNTTGSWSSQHTTGLLQSTSYSSLGFLTDVYDKQRDSAQDIKLQSGCDQMGSMSQAQSKHPVH